MWEFELDSTVEDKHELDNQADKGVSLAACGEGEGEGGDEIDTEI